MNYVQTNHIGNHQATRRNKHTTTAQTNGRIHKMDAANKRQQSTAKGPKTGCAGIDASNAILKCRFLPKLALEAPIEANSHTTKTERDFYRSLSKAARSYGIKPMQTETFGFPYNIALSIWDINRTIKNMDDKHEKIHIVQHNNKILLAKKEVYNTETYLYYIPLIPLFKMYRDTRYKKNAMLLLSVFSYLYRIVDVPFYRSEDSYMYWQYEMMNDWVNNDLEDEDTQSNLHEIRQAACIGDIMEKKFKNRINLDIFEQRLKHFSSIDKFDEQCFQIAYSAFDLYTEYPQTNIFRNAPILDINSYEEEQNSSISMEKYISFTADSKGWLHDTIIDCINNEFNEYGIMSEPTIYIPIDGSRIAGNNFDFEKRMFDLLNELSALLYNY